MWWLWWITQRGGGGGGTTTVVDGTWLDAAPVELDDLAPDGVSIELATEQPAMTLTTTTPCIELDVEPGDVDL